MLRVGCIGGEIGLGLTGMGVAALVTHGDPAWILIGGGGAMMIGFFVVAKGVADSRKNQS